MANQQQIAAALNDHDRIKRSTELPLYFGNKTSDSISAKNFVDRLEKAAQIANWDQARKCNEFYMVLRDKALIWYESLEDAEVDVNVWDDVKKEFLAAYEPRFTAKTTCTNFHELQQRQGEGVQDYFLRVQEAFKKMCRARPAATDTVRGPLGGATQAEGQVIKKEGIQDSEKFFKHQLFIAGLREGLRDKIMEAGKTSIQESLALARELEIIHADRKKSFSGVRAITEENKEEDAAAADFKNEDDDAMMTEGLEDDEIELINAIRRRRGKPGFRPSNKSGGSSNKGTLICRYCKKKGHLQKECYTRARDKAPMVDAQGKPYKKAQAITTSSVGRAQAEGKEPLNFA